MTLSRIGFLLGLFCLVGYGYVSAQGIDATVPVITSESTAKPATTPEPTTKPTTTPEPTTKPTTTPEPTTKPTTTPEPTTKPTTTPEPTTKPTTTPEPTTKPTTTPKPTTKPTTTPKPTTKPTTTPKPTTKPTTTPEPTTKPNTTPEPSTKPTTTPKPTTKPNTTPEPTTQSTTQSNSTSGDVTTTPLITTAPTPSPEKPVPIITYEHKKDNKTCLMVQMATQFVLKNGTVINVTTTKVKQNSSSCSVLHVDFDIKYSFELYFGIDKDNKTYYLEEVHANIGGDNETATNLTVGKASMKASYKCIAGFSVLFSNNMTMNATSVQFQAFQVDDGKFGTAVDCKTTKDLNPIIPIVVGSVLAVLVLIVVVAYIIGRRRNRTGYEEI